MAELAVDQVQEVERPEHGLRHFLRAQTRVSMTAASLGTASILVLFIGTLVVLTYHGWTPWESVAEAILSPAQAAVITVSAVLGLAATALGLATFRRMDTRESRDGSLDGAIIGIQGIVYAGFYAWFRAGDVETFARNFFDFEIIGEFFDRFLNAMKNTIILAATGEALGISIGLLLAVLVISSRRVVRYPARIYIDFFRGTPLIWQLSFFFFGLVLGLRLELTAYQVAILVLGLNAGAYSAEVFRAGIQSIDRGQFEAARSLGMGYVKALRLVILPQAVRRVIPPLTNEFVILIKDTSLVSVLGLTLGEQELMSAGRDIFSSTFNATAFIGTALGYLVITIPMIRVVNHLEKRFQSGMTWAGP